YVPINVQTAGAIVAKLATKYRGRRIRLLAPLVVGRKGYYTDLAERARNKGYATLRADGVDLPTGAWPRLDRSKERDIELPGAAAPAPAPPPASSTRPSARARAAGAASSRSIREGSRTTRATAGARPVSAPVSRRSRTTTRTTSRGSPTARSAARSGGAAVARD